MAARKKLIIAACVKRHGFWRNIAARGFNALAASMARGGVKAAINRPSACENKARHGVEATSGKAVVSAHNSANVAAAARGGCVH